MRWGMLKRLRISTTLAIGLSSQSGLAFTLMGGAAPTIGWSQSHVQFHLNPENCPANVVSLLEKAFAVWNGVPTSSLRVSQGSDTGSNIEQVLAGTIDETPSIHCSTNMAALGLNPDVIPGVAMGARFDSRGSIVTGALVLNVQDGAGANINTFDPDLTVDVITHEIGHVLGLGHSADKNALMYYDASARTAASLAQDDVDGITYLYTRDEFGPDAAFGGCAVIGVSALRHPSGGYLIAGLALPIVVVLLRRRLTHRCFTNHDGS